MPENNNQAGKKGSNSSTLSSQNDTKIDLIANNVLDSKQTEFRDRSFKQTQYRSPRQPTFSSSNKSSEYRFLVNSPRQWRLEFEERLYKALSPLLGPIKSMTFRSQVIHNKPIIYAEFTIIYVYALLRDGEVLVELNKKRAEMGTADFQKVRMHQYLKEGPALNELRINLKIITELLEKSATFVEFHTLFMARFPNAKGQHDLFGK